jgi:hypothetical protein
MKYLDIPIYSFTVLLILPVLLIKLMLNGQKGECIVLTSTARGKEGEKITTTKMVGEGGIVVKNHLFTLERVLIVPVVSMPHIKSISVRSMVQDTSLPSQQPLAARGNNKRDSVFDMEHSPPKRGNYVSRASFCILFLPAVLSSSRCSSWFVG